MINLDGGFRSSFKDEVLAFCDKNNLEITYLSNLGNCYHYNISMDSSKAQKFLDYIELLEEKRRGKSFWYRLWN